MTLRVALVCPYSLAVAGGVQQQVVGLAGALAADGEDVTVLAPVGSGAYRPDGLRDVGVVYVGRSLNVPANGSRAPVALSPSTALRTLEALRQLRPDVVHVHEPLAPVVGPAAVLAHVAPTVGTFHRAGAGLGYRLAAPLARRIVGRLDACIAVSAPARDTLSAVLGRDPRCDVLFNAVDVELYRSAEPWPSRQPNVFFVGRHEKRKGLDVLLEAFRSIPGEVTLTVASDGPLGPDLRRSTSHDARVEWCGVISDLEKARRLAAADIFVAPARSGESFGVVLLEAMAAGAAVVASDLPGYRLAAGRAAVYVPPGDAGALAEAIVEVLGDCARRSELVAAGREVVAERSFRRLASLYVGRYREAARAPGAERGTSGGASVPRT